MPKVVDQADGSKDTKDRKQLSMVEPRKRVNIRHCETNVIPGTKASVGDHINNHEMFTPDEQTSSLWCVQTSALHDLLGQQLGGKRTQFMSISGEDVL